MSGLFAVSAPDPLAGLRARFRSRMAQALIAFEQASGDDAGANLRAEAHKLAGVAATLGFENVGRAAAKVDAIDSLALDETAVTQLIQALQQALAQEEPS